MYRRQVAVAAILGMSASYLLWVESFSLSVSAAVAVLVYFAVRWFIAWMYRIRYWYRRGTRGVYTRSCPDCGQYIYRVSGDWIMKCHRCGWTAGLPVVRWLTKSVPSIQLRRTVWSPQILVVVLTIVVVVAGAAPDAPADKVNKDSPSNLPKDVNPAQTIGGPATSQQDKTGDDRSEISVQGELNRTKIELLIHQQINQERANRGLSKLKFDTELWNIARYHSRDMGEQEYYSHVSPSGEDMADRYQNFGYNCRVPTAGNEYLTGAENIAYIYREGWSYSGNETLVASIFVDEWMNSKEHRENILTENWENHGAGAYVVEEGSKKTVYATQNFC